MKIIIADAHGLYREGLKIMLGKLVENTVFLEAESQRQVLDLLNANPDTHTVLMESDLKGIASLPFAQRLMSEFPRARIVICSGSDDVALIREYLAKGVQGYIPKSINNADIRMALRSVLTGKVYYPPMANTQHAMISPIGKLTPRQQQVLSLLSNGLSNKEIGRTLELAEGTVKAHVAALMKTLVAKNRIEVTNKARQLGAIG